MNQLSIRRTNQEQLLSIYSSEAVNALISNCSTKVIYNPQEVASAEEMVDQTNSVVVYHMCDRPRNNAGFKTLGGFASDEARDARMTSDSDRHND